MRQNGNWRYIVTGLLFMVVGAAIIYRLLSIQLSPDAELFKEQEAEYLGHYEVMYPARGLIVDRYGNILAGNKTVYEIGVDLQEVDNPETIALAMSGVLGLNYEDILLVASQQYSESSVYAVLANFVSAEAVAELEGLIEELDNSDETDANGNRHSLSGLRFKPFLDRSYPEKNLASNILGFVSKDKVGYFGVEELYNSLLAGVPERVWVFDDPNKITKISENPNGASLILTIDREIQASIEKTLELAIEQTRASAGTIIVMDPENGDILGMASAPRFDLNEYWNHLDIYAEDQTFNLAIQAYEPGSVFKIITMASAIDLGVVEPDTVYIDTGKIEIGGAPIHNWDEGEWGPQTMTGCMQHSLNVCLAWVATEIGAKDFYSYLQDFGFGQVSGIELSGESSGILKLPGDSNWYETELGTNSFGQGISATPIQMMSAISAIANDGKMVVPRIVLGVVDKGRQYQNNPNIAGAPISAETAQTMTDMLAESLEEEASTALVNGFRVAGKTGTADIATKFGYTSRLTNASFVGWGPADDPKFIVYVWLQKPLSSPWGSVVAAPVFKQVVEDLVVLINLPPDRVRLKLAVEAEVLSVSSGEQ